MLLRLWGLLVELVTSRPGAKAIQPALALVTMFVSVQVLLYEWLERQSGVALSLAFYMRSYLFKQGTVGFLALAVVVAILSRSPRTEGAPPWRERLARALPSLRRVALAGAVVASAVVLFSALSPSRVQPIRVRFFGTPAFDKYALAYLLYELNRQQRSWYFEVNFDEFRDAELTPSELQACRPLPRPLLCYAQAQAAGRPFIAITSESLGEDHFWQNEGATSVISTYRWEAERPPRVYEFLAHAVVINSIMIHLNAFCRGFPRQGPGEQRESFGGLFQFAPRRQALRPAILAAHLSPADEELLVNCFGPGYVRVAARLVALEWLRADPVRGDLARSFGIEP